MRNNYSPSGKLSRFFDENAIYLIMLAVFGSIVLCLLQVIIRPKSLTLLIISLTVLGLYLTITGFWAFSALRGENYSYALLGLVGIAMLAWAGILVFKPEAQLAVKTRAFMQTKKKVIDTDQVPLTLEITPTSYTPGEKGTITIQVQNQSDHPLTLETVMFETKKAFFEGFVIDYDSASPPIKERKEKLGLTIALFFLEDPLEIQPDGKAQFQVDMIANSPGDYSGDYSVVLFVDAGSVASPKAIPDLIEEFKIVVFPSP